MKDDRETAPPTTSRRKRYVRAVGPKLKKLLFVVFALFAALGVNALYLSSVTFLEWWRGETYQNYFYQLMFLGHLALGLALVLPVIVFGAIHIKNAKDRPNRRAVRVGYGLFAVALALLITGIVLTRLEGVIEIRDPVVRDVAYWIHVISPVVAIWLFVLHRLAGPRIKWRVGAAWGGVAAAFALGMLAFHQQDPKAWGRVGPASGEQYFFPSLSRTATGDFIPERVLNNDGYCVECHADVHERWKYSAHKTASFNNPAYLASVLDTRRAMFERDGNVQGARFCAGCHDLVPFFSGAFDDPKFDDPDYDLANDPGAQAGITCTGCHAITHVNSVRGNADYTIEEPSHYPFTFSENRTLRWVNRTLVKAKPAFHKKTFLKDLHRSAEFCGTCHKVHLPEELNAYKWLRGQNHYDAYLLSGVSGHGAQSFYYPPEAQTNCNGCHMALIDSSDFGARDFDGDGGREVHDHLFPSANAAIPYLLGFPEHVIEAHREFNDGVMRVDLFGIREDGAVDGRLIAPLRPELPVLEPGRTYLLETVIRTVKMGHTFTQGTSDSNEVWMDVAVRSNGEELLRSGAMDAEGAVDPWAHFVNSFVLDRDGYRIDRRNAQDIFVALYNHQIPPGAGEVVHYRFTVPEDQREPLTVEIRLRYRKFDKTYVEFFQGEAFDGNDLPVLELASDRLVFPVVGAEASDPPDPSPIPEWQRWNDYGIGLLRKGDKGANKGQLRQAEQAFAQVERLGRADGPLNLARVFLKEGRVDEAAEALARAGAVDPPAPDWSRLWFGGQVNMQNGYLDDAIASFRELLTLDTDETRRRKFDFSEDYRVWNELGLALFERSKQERGDRRADARERFESEAIEAFERALRLDPENLTAHYNLGLIHARRGDDDTAAAHRAAHAKYKPDDNARDRAVAEARRRYPAANRAAEPGVVYTLESP